MNRSMLQRHLVSAERRASRGELQLERQRATVDALRNLGWDSLKAETLLVEFEQAQTLRLVDLDRLRGQLAAT
jgi:hypothetical protein